MISALAAAPIFIGIAYGVTAVQTGGNAGSDSADAASDSAVAGTSLAYGLLLWIGAPVAFDGALPLLAGVLTFFTKS